MSHPRIPKLIDELTKGLPSTSKITSTPLLRDGHEGIAVELDDGGRTVVVALPRVLLDDLATVDDVADYIDQWDLAGSIRATAQGVPCEGETRRSARPTLIVGISTVKKDPEEEEWVVLTRHAKRGDGWKEVTRHRFTRTGGLGAMEPTTLEACETWVGKEPSSTSRYAYVHRIDPAVVYLSDHWTRVRQKPEKDERGLGN